MPAVYHGRIKLKWCRNCNVPLVGSRCDLCSSEGVKVAVTPPADVRPAFEGDLEIINSILLEKYGIEEGLRGVVLMNRLPAEDLAYEIIYAGKVIGILKYADGFDVVLKAEGAELFRNSIKKRYVIAEDSVEEFLLEGKNLMVPGVKYISPEVSVGDYVVVICGNSIGVGISRICAGSVPRSGMAVKMKSFKRTEKIDTVKLSDWNKAISANESSIRALEKEAIGFINRTVEEMKLPVLLSFSGGKDSMATLLLLLKAKVEFEAFFIDTGLEFLETLEYISEVEKKYKIKIEVISVGDKFWKLLNVYGPPARNYRWCCKVVKLGPTAKFIVERYPQGSLTFIGQRRYESDSRSKSGRIWRNPWIMNQIGASPIYDWNALEVFLYLFLEGAPINRMYIRGLNRIGCYLCPASDLGDLEIARRYSCYVEGWIKLLKEICLARGFSEEWVKKGLWRWRSPSDFTKIRNVVDSKRYRNLLTILGNGPHSDKDLEKILKKAEECVGCGVCLPYCKRRALYIKEDRVWVDEEKCNSCKMCLRAPCIALYKLC